jgi:hypothetical protein
LKELKAYEDIDDLSTNPYGNQKPSQANNGAQEFHYSGSFGIPGAF